MASAKQPDWDGRSSAAGRSSMRRQRGRRLKVPWGARWRQPERTVARVPFAGPLERTALGFERARWHHSFVHNDVRPWVPCSARWRQPERACARVPFAGPLERTALGFERARWHHSFVQNGGQPWVPCGARWRQPERICARVPFAGSPAGPALGFARARRHRSFVQNGVQPRRSLQAACLGSNVHAEPRWCGLLSAARSGLFCDSRRERWVRSCREWRGGESAYGIIRLRFDRFIILSCFCAVGKAVSRRT